MAIFGIPDRSRKVTWRFILAVAVLGACMFAMDRWAPGARKPILWGFFGLMAAFIILVLVIALTPHPANRIVRLLKARKIDEACALGDSLLEKRPDDPPLQLNCVAAYVEAGNLGKARQILGTIRKERLRGAALTVYAHWEEKLNPAKPA